MAANSNSSNGATDSAAATAAVDAATDSADFETATGEHLQVVGADYALRYAVSIDAERLYELGCDPAVTRFFSWGPYTSLEQPLAYIEGLAEKRSAGSLLEFVVVDRADNQIVGVTGLTEFSLRDRRAVVGSWLGHRYWGTGVNLASKALVLALGFEYLGLERISAYSHVRNGRSKAALDRIGFHTEGILQAWHWHRGEPQDVTLHCLLREQYLRSEAAEGKIEISGQIPAAFRLPASV